MASFVSSYIPTEGSTVTRAADVASITGTNFSSWYRQDAGSARIEWDKRFTGNWTSFASFFVARDSAAPSDNVITYLNSNGTNSQVYYASEVNNISQLSYAFYSVNNAGPYTSAAALTTNSAALAQGGAIRGTDSSLAMPTTLNEAVIGPVNSTIRRITFWPTRLPNETLQGITQ
jgi:hypothetical protein